MLQLSVISRKKIEHMNTGYLVEKKENIKIFTELLLLKDRSAVIKQSTKQRMNTKSSYILAYYSLSTNTRTQQSM